MAMTSLEWGAIVADPRFQVLHRKKQAFLTGLMIFSVFFYFLLPIGAAYFPALYSIKVWGPINVGLLFALSAVRRRLGHRLLLLLARQQRVRRDGARTGRRVREESEGVT